MKININKINLDERKILNRYMIFNYSTTREIKVEEPIIVENIKIIPQDVNINISNNGNIADLMTPEIDTSGC